MKKDDDKSRLVAETVTAGDRSTERVEKFTPGPWSYCCDRCVTISSPHFPVARATMGDWGDDYPGIRIVGGSLDQKCEPYMAQITYGHVPASEAIANAHLIAAAPDMLDALTQVERALTQHNEDRAEFPCNWDFGAGCDGTLDAVRAAIRKARGEQS